MNRTIKDIQKDIELLGIKGGYDIEQLLTPQDCRRLSYEIERLNNIINELENIIDIEMNKMGYAKYDSCLVLMKMKINELKGSDK